MLEYSEDSQFNSIPFVSRTTGLAYPQYDEKQIQFSFLSLVLRTTKSKRSVARDALSRRFQCGRRTTNLFLSPQKIRLTWTALLRKQLFWPGPLSNPFVLVKLVLWSLDGDFWAGWICPFVWHPWTWWHCVDCKYPV